MSVGLGGARVRTGIEECKELPFRPRLHCSFSVLRWPLLLILAIIFLPLLETSISNGEITFFEQIRLSFVCLGGENKMGGNDGIFVQDQDVTWVIGVSRERRYEKGR
jgi:hypothetical protein